MDVSHDRFHMSHCQNKNALVKVQLKLFFPLKLSEWTATKNYVQDKKFNERFILLFIHGYRPICYLVLYRVLHAPSVLRSGVRLMQLHRQNFHLVLYVRDKER